MWTKNGKIFMMNIMRSYVLRHNGVRNSDFANISLKAVDGTTVALNDSSVINGYPFPQINNFNIFSPTTIPGVGLFFGSGSTPPTENDYTLDTLITVNNQSISTSFSKTYLDNDGNVCCDVTYLYYNRNTSQSVTIREFGFGSVINNISNGKKFMVYRDVFDEPITIAPGESKFITVTIKMSW